MPIILKKLRSKILHNEELDSYEARYIDEAQPFMIIHQSEILPNAIYQQTFDIQKSEPQWLTELEKQIG